MNAGSDAPRFDPILVEGVPTPARRWLLRAIAPNAPLPTSARLVMHGRIRTAPEAKPFRFEATEDLTPGDGFVWRARAVRGPIRIRGHDRYEGGAGEMAWRLFGIVPVARADGDDVTRSARGRLAGESFLVPPAFLPTRGAGWEYLDERTARATLLVDGEAIPITLAFEADGRLRRVSLLRWKSDADVPGYALFACETAAERTFDGITIPTRLRAGWGLGESGGDPFFECEIDAATYR